MTFFNINHKCTSELYWIDRVRKLAKVQKIEYYMHCYIPLAHEHP